MTCPQCNDYNNDGACPYCGSVVPPERVVIPSRRVDRLTPGNPGTSRSRKLRTRLAVLERDRAIAVACNLDTTEWDEMVRRVSDQILAEEMGVAR